ncbi:YihY/virulence factor BrkB family protein [Desertihabitans aurantiacus]|uniref:YihY/virulence factor BrkB family protein n=1 Tax=Desertihabitans aurantiacus TaxID=2282477 RepID=UPI000DF85B21|nr:YihY/virulence factor BrkB family protein [Desertihabitans aurantiacus]
MPHSVPDPVRQRRRTLLGRLRARARLVRSLVQRVGEASGALRVVWQTLAVAFTHRLTGLAAEAAFFAILSLPPMLFGLAGAVGFVAGVFEVDAVSTFRADLLRLASAALTGDAVSTVIAPTLDDVLASGRADVVSVGFLLALWAGSRSTNVFIETITIMYGMAGERGIVRTRLLSVLAYLVFLLIGVVVLPLILAGPSLIDLALPDALGAVGLLYWPVVLLLSVCMLATVFHLAVPHRSRWRSDLPGAGLTVLLWLGGSALLRAVLGRTTGTASVYGPLAAPIAVLLWLYLVSIAVLLGAALNAAVDKVWPHLSGLHDGAAPDRQVSDSSAS